MRLTLDQIRIIKATVAELAGDGATVKLFGSRTDDTAKGGDIDLLVELPVPVQNALSLATRLEARLERRLGGRRVDVILTAPNLARQPIHAIAEKEGIQL